MLVFTKRLTDVGGEGGRGGGYGEGDGEEGGGAWALVGHAGVNGDCNGQHGDGGDLRAEGGMRGDRGVTLTHIEQMTLVEDAMKQNGNKNKTDDGCSG